MKATARRSTDSARIASDRGNNVAALFLNDRGMIRDCNRVGETLFAYRRGSPHTKPAKRALPGSRTG